MSSYFQTSMRRLENQPAKPTAGSLSVPLFNQKKRSRVPLTSAPSENEFFSHREYMASTSSATSHSTPGTYTRYQASASSSSAPQNLQWNRQGIQQSTPPQQYGSNRPAPGPAPAVRTYTPMPHPYKAGGISSKMGQPSNPVRQQGFNPSVNRQSKYQAPPISESAQVKPTPHTGFSQMGQQSSSRPTNPTHQYSQQQPRPLPAPVPPPSRPSARAAQPQNNSWKFTNSFGSQRPPFVGNRSTDQPQAVQKSQDRSQMKPAFENSLRILTSVIAGMRHWSQFKDKLPHLSEIFGTLDSAVTLGRYGAKNFLMRDGRDVVPCLFYENEQELPRLIRGQVHRCVGNYDRSRDVLVCVSVRPGLPSELRNAQEAVKVCDAEMRALVKLLNEV